mmetsp:Transcript_9213/g.25762  ORF Transcript_9213/g.25762 Transcript_9213/m.25762 type:complete len:255 (-) Transcript_9213:64-828(-)
MMLRVSATGCAHLLLVSACSAVGDELGLVQRDARVHGDAGRKGLRELGELAAHSRNFNCTAFPELCEAPFNCQTFQGFERDWVLKGVRDASPRTWCTAPQYHGYVDRCLGKNRDLVSAAKFQFGRTLAGDHGPYCAEMDGSYCFIEGHCVNDEVTNQTTLEEASQMCDRRYGRERWAAWGAYWFPHADRIASVQVAEFGKHGFSSRSQTTPFLIAACAMGNFHCDIMYCKETYCKMPYFVDKYGHFLKKFGWVK